MALFAGFKRGLRKAVIFILILCAIAIAVITFTTFGGKKLFAKKATEIIIDSDSGNDIDDLFALARALSSNELDVIGLTSAHWSLHEDAGEGSLDVSQSLNEKMLNLMDKSSIPHPRGAKKRLWYFDHPVPKSSPAADFIIQKANQMSKGKKLNIVSLGALTNIASAVIKDTTIANKLRLYFLGMNYDAKRKIWNKNEFNAKNDLDALDYLLNTDNLEIHIMPANIASSLKFNYKDMTELMKADSGVWGVWGNKGVGKFLLGKWDEHFYNMKEKTMWDVALIEALIDPDLTRKVQVLPPPENKQRPVGVYTFINKEMMEAAYWSGIKKAKRQ